MTKEETEQLLEEAKRRYPVGTKYSDNGIEYEVEEAQYFKIITLLKIYGNNGAGCLMYDGKWAEIISLPEGIVPIESSPLQSLFQKLMN